MGTSSGLILKHFVGREDVVAVQQNGGTFRPAVQSPPTETEFDDFHRTGKLCYGFYPMRKDNTVMLACVDIDNHESNPNEDWKKQVEDLYFYLVKQDFHVYVEHSANSGAHLWIFFNEPIEAYKPRAFFRIVSDQIDLPLTEVFPKQERLKGKGYGNLIRYPYFNKSHFVDVENDWAEIQLDKIVTTSPELLDVYATRLHTRLEPATPVQVTGDLPASIATFIKQNPSDFLSMRWRGDTTDLKDRSTSSLVMSMAKLAVKRMFQTHEIEQMIRVWCYEHNYEKGSRDDWVIGTVKKAYEFAQEKPVSHIRESTMKDCSLEFLDRLGTQNYMSTGVSALDLAGFQMAQGEMWVYGARPGMGKTAFALQVLNHNARLGVKTLFLSAEMGAYEIGRRHIQSCVGGTEEEWLQDKDAVRQRLDEYYKSATPTHFRLVNSIEDCERELISHVKQYGIELVCVDYIQLINSNKGGLYEQTTDVSKRLKGLCRDYNVAMIALSQLSREVEKRDSLEIHLADLANSGGIERDACGIACGYWWAKSNAKDAPQDAYEIFLLKRRNGPVHRKQTRIVFDGQRQLFSSKE